MLALEADPAFRVGWPVVLVEGEEIVSPVYDVKDTAVTKLVGPDGATISATGTNGATYTLTIPRDALLLPTDVSLRPLTGLHEIDGTGLGVYGVDFAPHGLVLFSTATLEIVPADAVFRRHAEAIAYDGNGSNLHRVPIEEDPDHLRLAVEHFSGELIYRSETDSIPVLDDVVPEPAPDTWESLMDGVRKLLATERDAQLRGTPADPTVNAKLATIYEKAYRAVINPMLVEIATDCAKAKVLAGTVLSFARSATLLGMAEEGAVLEEASTDISAAYIDGLNNCWKEKTSECLGHDPSQIVEVLGIARQLTLLVAEPEGVSSYAYLTGDQGADFYGMQPCEPSASPSPTGVTGHYSIDLAIVDPEKSTQHLLAPGHYEGDGEVVCSHSEDGTWTAKGTYFETMSRDDVVNDFHVDTSSIPFAINVNGNTSGSGWGQVFEATYTFTVSDQTRPVTITGVSRSASEHIKISATCSYYLGE